jgi:23S rRNA (adenine2503-C2)-methyltransferase
LLPINRKYPLYELMQACREYINLTRRRLTFEWALISEVNDTDKDAYELAKLLKGMICHVNIIPLNPTKKYHGKTTSHERALAFQTILTESGIPCTIRLRRGIDIHAGCGQLASRQQKSEKTDMI